MKSEEIINHVDLNDAKRIIIFVEKEKSSQILEWDDPGQFSVATAGTRREMHRFVRWMYDRLHHWMLEDIPDYPLGIPKAKKR